MKYCRLHPMSSIGLLQLLLLLLAVVGIPSEALSAPPPSSNARGTVTALSSTALSSSSSDNENAAVMKPVLVVGATGRVGRKVVQSLLAQNVPIRAVVRNTKKAQEIFGTSTSLQYPSLQIIKADLAYYEDYEQVLDNAMEGCSSVISVMGVVRFSQLADFLPWRLFRTDVSSWAERDHPYFGNYLGQVALIRLAEKHNVDRFVRLTGLGVAYSAFNPFSILFNSLLTCNNRWTILCEQALAQSKVPYVVLRPGGLAVEERNTATTNIQLDPTGKLPFPGRIGRSDVAALCVAAALLPQSNTKSYTFACRWCGEDVKPRPQGKKEDGYASATEAMDQVILTNPKPLPAPKMKPYGLAVAAFVYTTLAIALRIASAAWALILKLFIMKE